MTGHLSHICTADLVINPATRKDLESITAIYNQAILNTTATFDTQEKSEEEQEIWYDQHGDSYPLLVARLNGAIVGWAALSPWSDRCAYETTAEVSVYVADEHRGQGVGIQLLQALLEAGTKSGLHLAVARIVEGNPASLRLHKKVGFRTVGTLKEAGYKFEQYLDVIIMEKLLDGSRK
ncbi:MAG: N-acetyltransferase [Fidelibacterota bacterium]|nr:MAG: N-acetyltransferase [Candidatus Neomarinimicrobiota bacterium]